MNADITSARQVLSDIRSMVGVVIPPVFCNGVSWLSFLPGSNSLLAGQRFCTALGCGRCASKGFLLAIRKTPQSKNVLCILEYLGKGFIRTWSRLLKPPRSWEPQARKWFLRTAHQIVEARVDVLCGEGFRLVCLESAAVLQTSVKLIGYFEISGIKSNLMGMW